eukprot:gene29942-36163_t
MGLLVEGKALAAEELQQYLHYIRQHGILQFLNTWRRQKDIQNDELKFGDEIESGVFVVDHESKTVKISLRATEIRAHLNEKEAKHAHETEGCTWQPEFGAWMVESTPSRPYTGYTSDLARVERNMVLRRKRLLAALKENEISPTVTSFPLMGCGDFIDQAHKFDSPYSQSQYIPDYCINPHPRFAALVRNIRMRRGEKVNVKIPLFRDVRTPEFTRNTPPALATATAMPDGYNLEEDTNIHMDCMAFGMGMCCLQVTFQAQNCDESRYMYDQLAVLAPIMMAMTAASPIFKGRLADIDVRWTVISQSVDDRTPVERGAVPSTATQEHRDPHKANDGIMRIPKSRYDSVSTYIYHCLGDPECMRTFAEYNDISCPIDESFKAQLRDAGVDENLAHHIAHLFCRDPLVAFSGQIELDDESSTDHFESIQSTNWQSCRWKPPPPSHGKDHIGWRTEFRTMEVQMTDFENAAFVVFIVLVTRVILAFDLGLYIPLSKVDENMARAHRVDAVRSQKFFFRKHIAPLEDKVAGVEVKKVEGTGNAPDNDGIGKSSEECFPCRARAQSNEDAYEEMTMSEIFLGKGEYFPGLLPLVYAYLDFINCDAASYKRIREYLSFIEKRATGELLTAATWMRQFVSCHPDYKQDSVVPPSVAYDLLMRCQDIGEGKVPCPEVLGDFQIERVCKEDAYGTELAGRLTHAQRGELVKKLVLRASSPRPSYVARGKSRAGTMTDASVGSGSNSTK